MPQPRLRSRSLRRVSRRLPGGRVRLHYRRRKPRAARCGGCGRILPGVPRLRPVELRKLAKTERRPERPFGGVLCSKCTRQVMVLRARGVAHA